SPITLRRSTIGNAISTSYNSIRIAAANAAPIVIEDSIIIGNGSTSTNNVIYNESTSPISVTNSAIVLSGSRSMSGTGFFNTATVTQTDVVTADPVFAETLDIYSPAFYQVSNPDYLTAGSDGGPLVGG